MFRKIVMLCWAMLSVLISGGCSEIVVSDELKQIMEQKSGSLQEIWAIEDEDEFISEMYLHVAQKCDHGISLDTLSSAEQVFYITQTLEMEVNNGGFWQFLFNVEEDVFVNTASAFSEIGASKTEVICQNAFSAFGEELPKSRLARMGYLMKVGIEECYKILSEFDEAFYEYEEDLSALNYGYVRNNKEAFK